MPVASPRASESIALSPVRSDRDQPNAISAI
jgi:hypothetical protein